MGSNLWVKRMYDFHNKSLVLTGANGGIGRETAKCFYQCGANLVLADIDKEILLSFCKEQDFDAQRFIVIPYNARNDEDAETLIARCLNKFDTLDFLVPSAGIYKKVSIPEMSMADWRETMEINLDSVFLLTKAAFDKFSQDSSIVMLSSLAAHRGAFSNAHYSATKGAILSLTRSIARELGPKVRVNAISPGIIETAMTKTMIAERGNENTDGAILKRLGRPEEVASVIAFLCSEGASFITGEHIHVNGGFYVSG